MTRLTRLVLHPITLLLATALACHALLPLTDYRCEGDLWLTNWVAQNRLDYLYSVYSESGRAFTGYYFGLFHFLPEITTTFKVLGLLLSAATGILVYLIALRTRFVTRLEALFLGVVTIAFPGDKMTGGFMYSKPHICTFAFLLAVLLMLLAERRRAFAHWSLRASALLLFCFSFLVESHLTYFGGFILLLVLLRQRDLGLPWHRIPWSYCLRRLDLALLPFLFWAALCTLTRAHGSHYGTYNRPAFSLVPIVTAYASLPGILLDPFVQLWSFSPRRLAVVAGSVFLTALIVAAVAYASRRQGPVTDDAEGAGAGAGGGPARALGLLLFGLILLVLGTIPYVAVNKVFVAWGEESRYLALVPLPVGIILLAVGTVVLRPTGPRLRALASGGLALAVAACVVVWVAAWWDNYASLQAVQIRNDAILRKVHEIPEARDCSVYCVLDQFPIPHAVDDLNTWQWTYLESGVFGEPRSIAFMAHPGCRPLTAKEVKDFIWVSTIPYALTSIDASGKQGLVIIQKSAGCRFPKGVLTYLYLKYCAPKRLGAFLDGAVNVEFVPAPWGAAADDRLRPSNP